jgi:hypothetical protein
MHYLPKKLLEEAHLAVYSIPPKAIPDILSLLTSLTTSLRTSTDKATQDTVIEHGWLPCAVFHSGGDSQNDLSNSLISVFLTKSETRNSMESGEQTTLGSHRFVHVFDSKHLAQPFEAVSKIFVI